MKKTKQFQWWNPISWIDAVLHLLGAVLNRIFRFFGLVPPPRTDGHENLQMEDIIDAEKEATRAQEAIDTMAADMTPAQIVHAYCTASEEGRKTMDLGKLTSEQQDWLLRLSDADLVMLGQSGEAACKQSLEAGKLLLNRAKLRPAETEAAPHVLRIPGAAAIVEETSEDEKRKYLREFIAARHSELFMASGAANPNPKFAPRATLH
jgi:hypothetical protein